MKQGGYLATTFLLECRSNDYQTAIRNTVNKFKTNPGYIIGTGSGCSVFCDTLSLLGTCLTMLFFALLLCGWSFPIAVLITAIFGNILNKDFQTKGICNNEAVPVDTSKFISSISILASFWLFFLLLSKCIEKGHQMCCKTPDRKGTRKIAYYISFISNLMALISASVGFVVLAAWLGREFDEVSSIAENASSITIFVLMGFCFLFKRPANFWQASVDNKIGYGAFLLLVSKILEWHIYKCETLFISYDEDIFNLLFLISSCLIGVQIVLTPLRAKLLHLYYRWRLSSTFYAKDCKITMGDLNKNGIPRIHITTTVNAWKTDAHVDNFNLYTITQENMGPIFDYSGNKLYIQEEKWPSSTNILLSDAMAYSAAAVGYSFGALSDDFQQDRWRVLQSAVGLGLGG